MIIGVPRERKNLERRVAITPEGGRELVRRGHKVLIEKDAGTGSGFADSSYLHSGCTIVPQLSDVWSQADLVVKVKEPHESEFPLLRKETAVFTYLHLASLPDTAAALQEKKVTSIGYELVTLAGRRLPLLEPMSEIAGKLSIVNGGYHLLTQNGGSGVLLGGSIGVASGYVVVIGAGTAGMAACSTAAGMGAQVTVLDISHEKLEKVHWHFGAAVRGLYSTPSVVEQECARADLLVGAVLIPGAATPRILTRNTIGLMKPGSVFVDISIDQGGCSETSKPTLLEKPTYVDSGVVHYGVCNMPSQTARTSTLALTSVTLPYIVRLADSGILNALRTVPELRGALNTFDGVLTNEAVGSALKKSWKVPEIVVE